MGEDKPGGYDRIARRSVLQAIGTGALVGGLALHEPAQARSAGANDPAVVDIAIIGAGLSGLTSARELQRAGHESFVVLEARDRVGGRTVNIDLGGGAITEGGGQSIGPGQDEIYNLAAELGIDTFDSYHAGKTVFFVQGEAVVVPEGAGGIVADSPIVDRINAMARTVPSAAPWESPKALEWDNLSLGDWLTGAGATAEDWANFSLSGLLTYGAAPEKLSLLHYLSLVNSASSSLKKVEGMQGGMQEKRIVGGSWALSLKMAENLADKLWLGAPVQKIAGWDRGVVEIHSAKGVVRARQVICAMSQSLCNNIAFSPPLPADRAALQKEWPTNAKMRKAALVYARPFWRDAGFDGQVLDIGGPLLWSADNSPPDASCGVLTAFIREGSLSPDTGIAKTALTAIFANAYGPEALEPTEYHEIDWGSVDPWSLSCTSPYQPGFLTRWGRKMREPMGSITWSGTDMAERFASAMDGAVRAGRRAALEAMTRLADQA